MGVEGLERGGGVAARLVSLSSWFFGFFLEGERC